MRETSETSYWVGNEEDPDRRDRKDPYTDVAKLRAEVGVRWKGRHKDIVWRET